VTGITYFQVLLLFAHCTIIAKWHCSIQPISYDIIGPDQIVTTRKQVNK